MTAFDVAALLIVLVSALVGWSRGAVKELVTLFAFTLAALAAIFLLPVTGPLAVRLVHPAWAGRGAAILVVFVVTYVALRVMGGWITQQIHAAKLGHLDRGAGAAFGVVRALVLLGAFELVFSAVTPQELSPKWITDGLTWPIARQAGRTLAIFAPAGMKFAGGVTKVMGDGVAKGMTNAADDGGGVDIGGAPSSEADPPTSPERGLTVHTGDTKRESRHKAMTNAPPERTR